MKQWCYISSCCVGLISSLSHCQILDHFFEDADRLGGFFGRSSRYGLHDVDGRHYELNSVDFWVFCKIMVVGRWVKVKRRLKTVVYGYLGMLRPRSWVETERHVLWWRWCQWGASEANNCPRTSIKWKRKEKLCWEKERRWLSTRSRKGERWKKISFSAWWRRAGFLSWCQSGKFCGDARTL